HFHAHAALVADWDSHHGATVNRRSLKLIGSFKVRVQPAIRVHTRIQQQADIIAVCENAIHKLPACFTQLLFAFGIPEQVLAVFADGNVGVHSVSIDSHHRLGQEAGGQAHLGCHLAANQFVELNLVGSGHHFAVTVVDLKL